MQQRGASDGFELDLKSVADPSSMEFLLTNGLGGYSSSSISCLNTRKYHGLLVSSFPVIDRRVMLLKLDEELFVEGVGHGLGVNDYSDGTRVAEGINYLDSVKSTPHSFELRYSVGGVSLVKRLGMYQGFNALKVSYMLSNNSPGPVEFRVNPVVSCRSIHGLLGVSDIFECKSFNDRAFGIQSPDTYLLVYNDLMESVVCSNWHRNFKYFMDERRGEDHVDNGFYPGYFKTSVDEGSGIEFSFTVASGVDERDCGRVFTGLSSSKTPLKSGFKDLRLYTLLCNTSSFLVDSDGRKSIMAGYHWFDDWGRDTMISLPGLCLVTGRLGEAERILGGFLRNVYGGRIPTVFNKGVPEYRDFDSSLWLIDRVNSYAKYAGNDDARRFLRAYWWTMKDIVKKYSGWCRDGILHHDSGTWMDTLSRSQAVEVQGLWYNALRVMKSLSKLVGDEAGVDDLISGFEDNFMENYWNGSYLDDCLGDGSIRPNQVLLLSMDYNVVPEDKALKILDLVDSELLTPYGLRTLARGDSRYRGRYVGGFDERAASYHNGTVWPWLLGPYVRAVLRYRGAGARSRCIDLVESFLSRHLFDAGLGCVSEVFDGDEPHAHGGCISQAWSLGELVRCYFEDLMPVSK
ncbi:MAG: amylo-alpha-1,6-glucosidase [Candidatus Altiarchaeota archaeon]